MKLVKNLPVFFGLLAMGLLLYGGSLGNGFVWDDELVISKNDFVKSWDNLPKLIQKEYLSSKESLKNFGIAPIGSGEITYRPAATFSYFLMYSLFGEKAWGYHATNILLHAINAFLLYGLSLRLKLCKRTAILASILFVGHPLQSEVINCISYNENLLCLLFGLAGLLVHTSESLSILKRSIVTGILFFLACLSKETGVIFFGSALIYDYLYRGLDDFRVKSALKHYLIPLAFLSLYLFARFYWFSIADSWIFYRAGTLWTVPLAAALSWVWLLWPSLVSLTFPDDPLFIAPSFWNAQVILSILFLFCLIWLAWKLRKSHPHATYGISWFFLGLVPVFGILYNDNASRFFYVALPGAYWIFAEVINQTYQYLKSKNSAVRFALFLLPLIYLTPTLGSFEPWKNNETFFSHLIEKYPAHPVIRSQMGYVYSEKRDWKSAAHQLEEALRLDPSWIPDIQSLARVYRHLGRVNQARELELLVQRGTINTNGKREKTI